jgi:hypothetical protein
LATPAATAFASREETPSKPKLATSSLVFSASLLSDTLKLSGAGERHTPGPGRLGSSYLPNVRELTQRSAALRWGGGRWVAAVAKAAVVSLPVLALCLSPMPVAHAELCLTEPYEGD